MSINIPDKIHKLIILIGLGIFSYVIFSVNKVDDKYNNDLEVYNKLNDSLLRIKTLVDIKRAKVVNVSKALSYTYNIKDPITKVNDSTIFFSRITKGNKNQLIVSDSIYKIWESYIGKENKYKLFQIVVKQKNNYLAREEKFADSIYAANTKLLILSIALIFFGIYIWLLEDMPLTEIKTTSIKQQNIIFRFCQSCGKRFSPMLTYGTNKDKTENYSFCCNCYKKGKFIEPNLTEKELLIRALEKNKNHGWLYKRLVKKRIKNLSRWNKKDY